jgi:predicted GNAT family N-acyltransferase
MLEQKPNERDDTSSAACSGMPVHEHRIDFEEQSLPREASAPVCFSEKLSLAACPESDDWAGQFHTDASPLPALPHPGITRTFQVEVYKDNLLPDIASASSIGPLFHRIYGNRYVIPPFTDVGAYLDEIRTGKTVVIMVRDQAGDVVAHGALIKAGEKTFELGRLVVDQSARGFNLGKVVQQEWINQLNVLHSQGRADVGITEALTSHLVTQKMFAALGWQPVAIFDRKYTDFLNVGVRETVLRMAIILDPKIALDRKVFIPSELVDISEKIYGGISCNRTITSTLPSLLARVAGAFGSTGNVTVDDYELIPFGASTVHADPGADPIVIEGAANGEFARGAQHVSVRFDINSASALSQIQHMMQQGFYFAALETLPSGDFMILQRTSNRSDLDCCPSVPLMLPQASQDLLEKLRATRVI